MGLFELRQAFDQVEFETGVTYRDVCHAENRHVPGSIESVSVCVYATGREDDFAG